jgi:cytochrome P450
MIERFATVPRVGSRASDPYAVDFDPLAAEFRADPGPVSRSLRSSCPIHHNPEFAGRGIWTLSQYEDVEQALRNHALWSVRFGAGPVRLPEEHIGVLNSADPPLHTAQRSLISRAFTPRAVASMEPVISNIASELLDARVAAGSFDLVADFAYPLPVIVIARMLGISEARMADFKRWSDQIASGINQTPETIETRLQAINELHEYFRSIVRPLVELREQGEALPEHLVGTLVGAELGERRLDEREIVMMLHQLLVAGNETTTSLLANLVYRLLTTPSQMDLLLAHPDLLDNAIEESLRLDSPIQGIFRENLEPVRIHGVDMDAYERTWMLIASANRDESMFDEPDEFRIDRDPTRLRQHVAFGVGVHYCLGASLARLEARVAMRELIARLPNLRLVGSGERVDGFIFRGFARLPVAWDAPASPGATGGRAG